MTKDFHWPLVLRTDSCDENIHGSAKMLAHFSNSQKLWKRSSSSGESLEMTSKA
jgi:hypothetical protein